MKRTITLLFLVAAQLALLASPTMPWLKNARGPSGAGAPPSSYIIEEDWEGTGTPSGWFNSGSDTDYTPALVGSQSLQLDAAGPEYISYTSGGSLDHSEVWFKIRVKITTLPSSFSAMIELQDVSFGECYKLTINSTGTITVSGGGIFETTVSTMSTGTEYDIWGHFKKNTGGNNGAADVAFDTAGSSRPTSGNNYAGATTGGTVSNNAERFNITAAANGLVFVADTVRVSDTAYP